MTSLCPFFLLILDFLLFELIPSPLALLLLPERLLLQWSRFNMMPFNLELEANNLGQIFYLLVALVVVDLGLLLF
jgi:hypothetical protein